MGKNMRVGIGIRIRNTEVTEIRSPIPGNLERGVGAGRISIQIPAEVPLTHTYGCHVLSM